VCQPGERFLRISAFAEWLPPTDDGVKVFVDTDLNQQPAVTPKQGNVRMIYFCEKIRTDTNWPRLPRFQCFISSSRL
jgi:hypothetical protein